MINLIVIYLTETLLKLVDLFNKLLPTALVLNILILSTLLMLAMYVFSSIAGNCVTREHPIKLFKKYHNFIKKSLKISIYLLIFKAFFLDTTYIRYAINTSYAISIYKTDSVQQITTKLLDTALEKIKETQNKEENSLDATKPEESATN